MSWLADLATLIRGDAQGNFKALTAEFKYLKEEYKQKFLEQEKINAEKDKRIAQLEVEINSVRSLEENCLHDQRILKQQYTDLYEKFIFYTEGNHRSID